MSGLDSPATRSQAATPAVSPLQAADQRRRGVSAAAAAEAKSALGQFMTPLPTARFMASLFAPPAFPEVRILDPGAGVGSLTAALVEAICRAPGAASSIAATCYEVDPALEAVLLETLRDCGRLANDHGLGFTSTVRLADFVEDLASHVAPDMFTPRLAEGDFTHVILNPPYRKIQTGSLHRRLLRRAGIETSNLYTAFVALSLAVLSPGGQLVAITPRSFCNGPYFMPFRRILLTSGSLLRVHTFESRDLTFREDDVLQENIIFLLAKHPQSPSVTVSASAGPDFATMARRDIPFAQVVHPSDDSLVIHIPTTEADSDAAQRIAALACSLDDLSIQVSTGPVVDFRMRGHIHRMPSPTTVPLLYAAHFRGGIVTWPLPEGKKPNAIKLNGATRQWLMPSGNYVVTRRFSSKEERRRVYASLFTPLVPQTPLVGFENHLNVFHSSGRGLLEPLARGLCLYLNSSIVDRVFRQFNGHTQVNATDLRSLRYPSAASLEGMGRRWIRGPLPAQDEIDGLVEPLLLG